MSPPNDNITEDLLRMRRLAQRGEMKRRAQAQAEFRAALAADRQGRPLGNECEEENNARVLRLNLIVEASGLPRTDIARRIGITPAHLYRLLRPLGKIFEVNPHRRPYRLLPSREREIEQAVKDLLDQAGKDVASLRERTDL